MVRCMYLFVFEWYILRSITSPDLDYYFNGKDSSFFHQF